MKRGRNQRRRQGVNPNRALDSNGPDVRIRGTANQIHDKYLALARDASSAGDRIKAESYLQHAEHYFRLIRSMQAAQQPQGQAAPAPSEDAENEQPAVEDGEETRRSQRGRRNANTTPSESAAEESAADAGAKAPQTSASDAPAAEEPAPAQEASAESADKDEDKPAPEKKPRRRRTTRRTTKRADDAGGSAAEPADAAAAE